VLQADCERLFATPASQSGNTSLETLSAQALTSSIVLGTHSSGLLELLKALLASMRVATFGDLVVAIPRSFPRKALYFLFIACFLASSSSGSCPNCASPCSCWLPRLPLRIIVCGGNVGMHPAGNGLLCYPEHVLAAACACQCRSSSTLFSLILMTGVLYKLLVSLMFLQRLS
jgi:hypothetical protein